MAPLRGNGDTVDGNTVVGEAKRHRNAAHRRATRGDEESLSNYQKGPTCARARARTLAPVRSRPTRIGGRRLGRSQRGYFVSRLGRPRDLRPNKQDTCPMGA